MTNFVIVRCRIMARPLNSKMIQVYAPTKDGGKVKVWLPYSQINSRFLNFRDTEIGMPEWLADKYNLDTDALAPRPELPKGLSTIQVGEWKVLWKVVSQTYGRERIFALVTPEGEHIIMDEINDDLYQAFWVLDQDRPRNLSTQIIAENLVAWWSLSQEEQQNIIDGYKHRYEELFANLY